MYNINCEIKNTHIILLIIFPILIGIDFTINEINSETYGLILVFIALVLSAINKGLKYLSLKKNGVKKYNVPYFIMNKPKGKIFYVNYTNDKGETKQLVKVNYEKKEYEKINTFPESGYTTILINPNNEKQYYIFFPNEN